MIIVTLFAILAAISFFNFEREKLKIELGLGQIWQTLIMFFFFKWALTTTGTESYKLWGALFSFSFVFCVMATF